VSRYLDGGRWKLVAEYVEVESGKRNSRPQLRAAISHAKATGAKLVIARLDRLARNLHFVSSLQERGVDFVAADMPDANRLTIHIIAAVAEAVGRTISENTKTALAAAKARGVKLGNPNGARALKGKQVGNADAVAKIKANVRSGESRTSYKRVAFGLLGVTRGTLRRSQGCSIDWPTRLTFTPAEKGDRICWQPPEHYSSQWQALRWHWRPLVLLSYLAGSGFG
jgi:DNA invertase Pin-like site-specific DNA recombinase